MCDNSFAQLDALATFMSNAFCTYFVAYFKVQGRRWVGAVARGLTSCQPV